MTATVLLLLLGIADVPPDAPTPPPLPEVTAPSASERPAEEVGSAENGEGSSETSAAELPPSDLASSKRVRIRLLDGQTLSGTLVSQDEHGVTLELSGGSHLEVARASIERIYEDLPPDLQIDPNRTRYLYAPSAMMLRQGEGYFSQKELLFSSAAYGATDWLSVLAGTVAPVWFLGPEGINFILGVKAGLPVGEWVHLAAGAEFLFLPGVTSSNGPMSVGFFFGTATVGKPNLHASVAYGRALAVSGAGYAGGGNVFTLSGVWRFHPNVAVVTENWLVPALEGSSNALHIHGLAARVLGGPIAVDVGAILPYEGWELITGGIPIPWLDFTYNFGIVQ